MSDLIYLKGSPKTLKPIIMQLVAFEQMLAEKDIGAIYGIPSTLYQETKFDFLPQITLHFAEDKEDVEPTYQRVYGEINFRITGETYKTISKAELTIIAQKVKEVFGNERGFVWKKGKVRCNYADRNHGYFLQILARSESEGRQVIQAVLSLQNHTPEWSRLNVAENADAVTAYPIIPPTETVLGERKRMPRKRPIANVRFTKAEAHIYSRPSPVILYDHTKHSSVALVPRL